MTETSRPPLSLQNPLDVIAMVPYLLGFHPEDSLVLVALREHRLVVTTRSDLDWDAEEYLPATMLAVRGGGADELLPVVFSNDDAPDGRSVLPQTELIMTVRELADAADLTVRDALLVCEKRWWSYLCEDPQCCPPEGMPVEPDFRIAAEMVHSGMSALAGRRAITASFTPWPEHPQLREMIATEVDKLLAADSTEEARLLAGGKRALFAASRVPEQPLTVEQLARFAVALRSYDVRDAVWLAIDHGRLDGGGFWRLLGRQLPAPFNAAPLFLAGWAAWRKGDGAQANIAVELALAADPDYSAATILQAALARGVSPLACPRLELP